MLVLFFFIQVVQTNKKETSWEKKKKNFPIQTNEKYANLLKKTENFN